MQIASYSWTNFSRYTRAPSSQQYVLKIKEMTYFNPNSSKKTFKERFWFAKYGSQHNPRPIAMADLMNFYDWTGLEQSPIPQPIPLAKEAGSQDVNFYSDHRYVLQYFAQWKGCVVPGEKEGFWERETTFQQESVNTYRESPKATAQFLSPKMLTV